MSEKGIVLLGETPYDVDYCLPQFPGITSIRIGNEYDEIWLRPSQCLVLLAWLEQERETLAHMAKSEQNAAPKLPHGIDHAHSDH